MGPAPATEHTAEIEAELVKEEEGRTNQDGFGMSTYSPHQKTIIAPWHARTALPVPDIKGWIKGAIAGQSFVLRDGPVRALSTAHKLWLDVWQDEGFITYGAVKASPADLSSHPEGLQVYVTRTEKEL